MMALGVRLVPRPAGWKRGTVRRAASEETDLFFQVIPLPEGEAIELLDGHPENTEELLLREVPLQGERQPQSEREREQRRHLSFFTLHRPHAASKTTQGRRASKSLLTKLPNIKYDSSVVVLNNQRSII